MYAQNNILFYDDCPTGGNNLDTELTSSFKVDSSVNPWYGEGDLIRTYYGGMNSGKNLCYWEGCSWNTPTADTTAAFLSTKDDPEMGNMQYIYAERYNITWNGGAPVFTKNSSNSDVKYYWLVLPDGVYTGAVGELFLATFEKLDQPVHFIILDTHSCAHQDICNQASADPENYAGGEGLLGALFTQGSSTTTLYEFTGGITGLHRIKGESKTVLSEFPVSNMSAGVKSASKDAKSEDDCDLLGELRTAMWNGASDSEKARFATVVMEETSGRIDGVEGYMNQILAYEWTKHNNQSVSASDYTQAMKHWLDEYCGSFRGKSGCTKESTLSPTLQSNIDKALKGSNLIHFSTGNASAGAGIGGQLQCVWHTDGCRTDLTYSDYPKLSDCGQVAERGEECWGNDGIGADGKWADAVSSQCGSCIYGEFVEYLQGDSRWGHITYGGASDTIASSGCGPASFAMIAQMLLGREILPTETAAWADEHGYSTPSSGTDHGYYGAISKAYGLEYEELGYVGDHNEMINKINEHLKNGWMILMLNCSHYVGVYELTSDGKWMVADSSSSSNNAVPHNPEDWMNGGWGSCNGPAEQVWAVKNTGSTCGSNSCGGDNSSGLVAGGMTLQQAEEFMKPYIAEANLKKYGTYTFDGVNIYDAGCKDGTLNNCVAFTQYFVEKYTKHSSIGTKNGNLMVDYLVDNYDGFKKGTEPRPYAVFSWDEAHNHTGIVLGVDTNRKVVIIGEASCHNGVDGWPHAKEYTFEQFEALNTVYAYTDDVLINNP